MLLDRAVTMAAGWVLLIGITPLLVMSSVAAQEPEPKPPAPKPFDPIDWPSTPPANCPFEASEDLVGITFTGRHREYATADCWVPSWASDGNLYSPYSDGLVANVLPDGSKKRVHVIGNKEANVKQLKGTDATNGVARISGDDPLNLTVTARPGLPTPVGPYASRYPSGSLVHDGIWYYGTHPEGPGNAGPFTGFMISKDYGKTFSSGRNDPTVPLFPPAAPFLDPDGKPTYVQVRIVEPFFVDFGKNMEHSPDGKAYLIAHGSTEPQNGKDRHGSHWHIGDQAFLLRVEPSPRNMNDASKYEFFAGHDPAGAPVWTEKRSAMKPVIEWNGHVGPTTMVWNPALARYLLCVTIGEAGEGQHGRYDTYILESKQMTGPWKRVVYMKHFGEQGYFVNFPSKFISKDGHTAWLCYSANFAINVTPTLKSIPPGSGPAMCLQEVNLRIKE